MLPRLVLQPGDLDFEVFERGSNVAGFLQEFFCLCRELFHSRQIPLYDGLLDRWPVEQLRHRQIPPATTAGVTYL